MNNNSLNSQTDKINLSQGDLKARVESLLEISNAGKISYPFGSGPVKIDIQASYVGSNGGFTPHGGPGNTSITFWVVTNWTDKLTYDELYYDDDGNPTGANHWVFN